MIEVHVLRTVLVAEPGNVYGREISAGTNDVVPADAYDGLKAEGYVRSARAHETKAASEPPPPAVPAPPVERVEFPADWRELHHMKLIALAKLFDADVSNKAEAIAVLEREEKALAGAAENKAISAAPENKSV